MVSTLAFEALFRFSLAEDFLLVVDVLVEITFISSCKDDDDVGLVISRDFFPGVVIFLVE